MKQAKYLIGLSVIVLVMNSCTLIARKMMGIKQPKIETNQSILTYMQKNGIISENSFHIDSVASYYFWKERGEDRMTNMEIYNGNGQLLKKLGSRECSGTFAKSLASIDLPAMKPVILTTKSLGDVLKVFRRMDRTQVLPENIKSDEFVVAIYWMKCFGAMEFKADILEWTKQLAVNPNSSKIKILYLNTDMHESWGIKSKNDDRRIVFDF